MTFPDPALASPIRGEFYRIIPSRFPPVPLFEALYDDAEEMEIAYALEALTNPRVRQEVGDLHLVPPDERVSGTGATVVMAPFTHLSRETRFSDGTFGVYYAAKSLETAIAETKYHRARFLSQTDEVDQEITMRVYAGAIRMRMRDLRPADYESLLAADDYRQSQPFARTMKDRGANGLLYPSVRQAGGLCLAVFRPRAVAIPKQRMHLKYVYRRAARSITEVYEARPL